MLKKLNRPMVVLSIVAAVVICLSVAARNSIAGKAKIAAQQLVIICTGNDMGQVKPACT